MDADEGKQNVIQAADKWARDVMRSERSLEPLEQALLDAVMNYRMIIRGVIKIPPPPLMPRDLGKELISEMDTFRYSDLPTIPTPPQGFPIVEETEPPQRLESMSQRPTKRVKGTP